MTKLRLGVLSTARIAVQKVIPGIARSGRCAVVAIASRDAAAAESVAARLGIPRAYGRYDDLLADDVVDAVYIPLPNHLHAPWTVAAAQAGKHVLCEKPLALDVAEARRMLDACTAAGVTFMEAFMYRLHPQWVRTREIVAAGGLGRLQAIQTYFAFDNRDPANIRNVAAYGGGALLDIGCYAIDLSRLLFAAEPVAVSGAVHTDPAFGVDVLASGLLAFPGGGQAGFTCGTQSAPGQWVHVAGSAGRLVVEVPFNAPPDRHTRLTLIAGGQEETIVLPVADQYAEQADAFAACVLDGAAPPVPPDYGVANLEVIARLRAAGPAARPAADA